MERISNITIDDEKEETDEQLREAVSHIPTPERSRPTRRVEVSEEMDEDSHPSRSRSRSIITVDDKEEEMSEQPKGMINYIPTPETTDDEKEEVDEQYEMTDDEEEEMDEQHGRTINYISSPGGHNYVRRIRASNQGEQGTG